MAKHYLKTGLKLILLELIAGILSWFIGFIFTLVGVLAQSTIYWVIMVIAMLFLSVFLGGFFAQKIWKWK